MTYEVVDNFLEKESLEKLQDLILGSATNGYFGWNIITEVAGTYDGDEEYYNPEIENQLWNWYGVHLIYNTLPNSPYFDDVLNIFRDRWELKSLMRIKANFYPYTSEVKEHAKHKDFKFNHKSAVFSLNTCDGFTRMSNGDKVDSVANRIVFFDGSEYHNSSTTSNAKGRYNINFNYF
jgi:hypothetical protein